MLAETEGWGGASVTQSFSRKRNRVVFCYCKGQNRTFEVPRMATSEKQILLCLRKNFPSWQGVKSICNILEKVVLPLSRK